MEYKTAKENFDEALIEARKLTVKDIKIALQQRLAMHGWAVKAYEVALSEKIGKVNMLRNRRFAGR